jgi:hypothetical protein
LVFAQQQVTDSKAVSDDINEKKKVAEVLNRCGWMMAGYGGFQ